MARELPYIAAIDEAIRQEMERDETVLYFGQNIATHEKDPFLQAFGSDRVRVTPISETAEIGMAIGAAIAGYRPVVELYMAEFMLVAMDQVVNEAQPVPLHERRPGEGADGDEGGLRLHGGLGGPAHGLDLRHVHGRPGAEGGGPGDAGRREGADDGLDPRRQPGRLLPPLPADARARRRSRGRARRPARPGERRAARAATSRSSRSATWSGRRSPPPSSWRRRASNAEVIDPRALAPLDTETILRSVEKTGRLVIVDQSTRHGSAARGDRGRGGVGGLLVAPGAGAARHARSTRRSPTASRWRSTSCRTRRRSSTAVQQVVGSAPVPA